MLHSRKHLEPEEIRLLEGGALRSLLAKEASGKGTEDCLFFDIETTGLSPDTGFIFLIGCICFDDDGWTLHQFFIRRVQEEGSMLSSFFQLAGRYQVLIHFNGTTFDLPFLRKRSLTNRLEPPFDRLLSIDLYQCYRPLRKKLGFSHMNQQFLEHYIGWKREDHLNGKEVVSLFWDYSVSPDSEKELFLLRHNRDDLLGMLRIPELEGYRTLFEGQILPDISAVESEDHRYLQIHFTTALPLPQPLSFSPAVTVDKSRGQLSVPVFSGTLKYFFPDFKNYYYLPLEKQAIHKSVASYVAKEYRVAARPENCFAEKTGRFLPQPEALFTPALRESYESKELYFEYENCFREQKESLTTYAKALLRKLPEKQLHTCV